VCYGAKTLGVYHCFTHDNNHKSYDCPRCEPRQKGSRGWRALRHGIELSSSTERLWITPSWEIYERWCFLRIGKLLTAATPAWGWHRFQNRWIGSYDGHCAELLLQPRFPANHNGTGKMWSISKERVPDLVL
jgi:hypothetical protein